MGGAAGSARASAPARIRLGLPALGWVLYDFANTIFSYAVITRYFNEWIIIERGQPDVYVGLMGFAVSVALFFTLPFFGALADRSGRRKPLLLAFTALCVGATALLGLAPGVLVALVLAGVAIFGFNSALAQYDPLLATVAPPERRSLVSGLGVGAGYVGVLVALFAFAPLVPEGQNERAFLPTAVAFAVFAVPCFLWVREGPRGSGPGRAGGVRLRALPRAALAETLASLRRAATRPWGRFLVARFLYVDAVATVIAFMTVYARRTSGLTGDEIELLLGLSVVFAVLGAVVAGVLVGRVGPKPVLMATVGLVATGLGLTGATGSEALLWVTGPLVGIALGAIWTSDRVLLLQLVPAERRGEVFGLYGLVGKLSSGVGPFLLWGGTIWLLSDLTGLTSVTTATRAALCALALAALAGLLVLRPLDPSPAALTEEPAPAG